MKELIKDVISIKGTKKQVIVCIVSAILYSTINALIASWIAKALGQDSADKSMVFIIYVTIGCIVCTVTSFISNLIRTSLRHISFTELNIRLSEKLANADYSFFEKYSTNHITTVVGSLYSTAHVYGTILEIVKNALAITATVTAICVINGFLIIPLFVIYTIGVLLTIKLYKRINKIDNEFDDKKHLRNKELQMLISGFSDVRTMCTQDLHLGNIKDLNISIMEMAIHKSKMIGLSIGLCEAIDGIITVLFIMISVILISSGNIQSTVAMSLIMYIWRLTSPLMNLIDMADFISETLPGYTKYKSMMDYNNEVLEGTVKLDESINEIYINNVSFSYNTSDTVLNDVSFKIRKGEKIGICGTSGEGKSTLLKLINRFYDPNDGEIRVDGIDIRHLTLNSLRRHIGTVSQKIYIFEGTVKDNIAYGNPNATEYDIIEASKKACLYDFIQSLPDKFNTNIGVDGLKLSGGQQQRVALARIFLLDPEIILLDEATSALDNESEAIVQQSLLNCKDKTIIAVAHRLSTIKNFDRIIVLNNHTIAECGNHDELIKLNGIYASLLKINK